MFNISFYLQKFQSIKNPKIFKREIVDALKEITGYKFLPKEIRFRKGVVTVESDSLLRSEVYQKREELIEKLSAYHVSDIR